MKLSLNILFFLLIIPLMGVSQEWIIPLSKIKGNITVKTDAKNEYIIYKEKKHIVLLSGDEKKTIKNIDSLISYSNRRFVARKNNLWGLYDINTKDFIIPAVYEKLIPKKGINGFFIVEKYGGKAIIDMNNNIILPYSSKYYIIDHLKLIPLKNGYYAYKWNKKWHFIPENHKMDEKDKPQDIITFPNGNKLIKYFSSKEWQLYDRNDSLLRKINYDIKIGRIYRNFCVVRENKLFGAMDFNGNIILPITKESKKCPELKLLVSVDPRGTKTFKKVLEQNILKSDFDEYLYISENLYKVKFDNKWAIFNITTNKILVDSIDSVTKTENRLIIAKKDSCYLFDKKGNLIKAIKGSFHRKFSYDRFIVRQGKEAFLLDKSGNKFYSFNKDSMRIYGYNPDFILIKKGNKPYIAFDIDNNEVNPAKLKFNVTAKINNKYIIKKGKKYGIIDRKLNVIMPAIYDYIGKKSRNLAIVKLNGKKGLVRI